eukprot:1139090-Pelagomonas_calceolata.AAC.1
MEKDRSPAEYFTRILEECYQSIQHDRKLRMLRTRIAVPKGKKHHAYGWPPEPHLKQPFRGKTSLSITFLAAPHTVALQGIEQEEEEEAMHIRSAASIKRRLPSWRANLFHLGACLSSDLTKVGARLRF